MKFTSKQLEKIVGIKAQTLHFYVEAGVITPGVHNAKGPGTVRYWDYINLVEASIIRYAIGIGLPKRSIISMLRGLLQDDRKKLDAANIMNIAGPVFLLFIPDMDSNTVFHSFHTPKDLFAYETLDFNAYDEFPMAIRINLKTVVQMIDSKIKEIG